MVLRTDLNKERRAKEEKLVGKANSSSRICHSRMKKKIVILHRELPDNLTSKVKSSQEHASLYM